MTSIVTLTDAQIKALPTTPFDLLPAPGAGKIIQFLGAVLNWDFAAGQYTNRNADCVLLAALNGWAGTAASNFSNLEEFNVGGRVSLMQFLSAFNFNQSSGPWTNYAHWTDNTSNPSSAYINTPLQLMVDNAGSGNFTGGNAANSLKVTVTYQIIDA